MLSKRQEKASRRLLVQWIFARSFQKKLPFASLVDLIQNEQDFAYHEKVLQRVHELDEVYLRYETFICQFIENSLKNWSFERVHKIDLAILQSLLAEMIFLPDNRDFILKDGAHLARELSSEDSPPFIQGILYQFVPEKQIV